MGSDLTEVTDLGMVEWGFIPVKTDISVESRGGWGRWGHRTFVRLSDNFLKSLLKVSSDALPAFYTFFFGGGGHLLFISCR